LNPLLQAFRVARIEAEFIVRFRKFAFAALVVACIPALYAVIYLSSVWDPAANTQSLAVALVNLDKGVAFHDHEFNIGNEVSAKLKSKKMFGFQDFADEAQARRAVRQGKIAFALVIPADFSSNAVPGARTGGGKLVVYTSEGNNYQGAHMARRFATDLGTAVNSSLNEQRWALVLSTAAGSEHSLEQLRDGAKQLRLGAKELSDGATLTANGARTLNGGMARLNDGVDQVVDGMHQLGTGLRTMDAARPSNADLARLKNGAEALATGHGELEKGFVELKNGTKRLKEGVLEFRNDTADSLLVPSRVTDGLDQVSDGVAQLDAGLHTAADAQGKLSDGATRVSGGVTALTQGMQAMGNGIHTMLTKLPEERKLNSLGEGSSELLTGSTALVDGTDKVKAGALRLHDGIELLANSLPSAMNALEGSAEGLANSVQPQIEVDAPVQNQGAGFAPNVLPAALWLGAGIIAFLFNVRVMPRMAQDYQPLAQFFGKLLVPATVVLMQALLVLVAVMFLLHIPILHPGAFVLTLAISSLTFLSIVFALTRALGDAGKALAMLFLAVQLSSSGGVLPVELSGGFFTYISPWLPMTWVVQAIKASMFGAYDDGWMAPLAQVAAAGLAATVMASFVGRWRYVEHTEMRPPIEF
jgi:putative membrane protein